MTNSIPLRIMCVDDHAFLIEGVRSSVEAEPGLKFVGSMRSLDGIQAEMERLSPDVLLLDLEVPGPDVFQTIAELKRTKPDLLILVLSGHVRDRYIDNAMGAGVNGYLTKSENPGAIISAIRNAAAGIPTFSSEVAERMKREGAAPRRRDERSGASRLHTLTVREQQVLRLIGQGKSRTDIATLIHRSPKTVDAHRASIMEKLGIHDRVELARYAIREGLVEV